MNPDVGLINKEKISNICNLVLQDTAPAELILVKPMVDVYLSRSQKSDLDVPMTDSSSKGLAFSDQSDLFITIVIPVVVATLSKLLGLLTDSSYSQVKEAILRTSKKDKNAKETFGVDVTIKKEIGEIVVKFSGKRMTKKRAEELAQRIFEATVQVIGEDFPT